MWTSTRAKPHEQGAIQRRMLEKDKPAYALKGETPLEEKNSQKSIFEDALGARPGTRSGGP